MFDTLFNTKVFKGWFTPRALLLWQPGSTAYFPSPPAGHDKILLPFARKAPCESSLHEGEHVESRGGRGVLLGRIQTVEPTHQKIELPGMLFLWRLLQDLLTQVDFTSIYSKCKARVSQQKYVFSVKLADKKTKQIHLLSCSTHRKLCGMVVCFLWSLMFWETSCSGFQWGTDL